MTKAITFTKATVEIYAKGPDIITLASKDLPGTTLTMKVKPGTGRQYVRDHFDLKPKVHDMCYLTEEAFG